DLLLLDRRVGDAAVVGVEAASQRAELGFLEGDGGGRLLAEEAGRIGDALRGVGRLVVGEVVDRAGPGPGHGSLQDGDDVLQVDTTEDLARLHDAPGPPRAQRFEQVAARAIDAGKAEDLDARAARLTLQGTPGLLRRQPPSAARAARRRGRILVHPAAAVV